MVWPILSSVFCITCPCWSSFPWRVHRVAYNIAFSCPSFLSLLTFPAQQCPKFFSPPSIFLVSSSLQSRPAGSSSYPRHAGDFRICMPSLSSLHSLVHVPAASSCVFPGVSLSAQTLISSPPGANSLYHLVPIVLHASDKTSCWPFPKHSQFIHLTFFPFTSLWLKL